MAYSRPGLGADLLTFDFLPPPDPRMWKNAPASSIADMYRGDAGPAQAVYEPGSEGALAIERARRAHPGDPDYIDPAALDRTRIAGESRIVATLRNHPGLTLAAALPLLFLAWPKKKRRR